jgi:ADP-heptose:LPS heptosyltransferase
MGGTFFKKLEYKIRFWVLTLFKRKGKSSLIVTNDIDFNSCKVLFLRFDKIGDALVSTPVFEILKKTYPNVTIDIVLSAHNNLIYYHNKNIRQSWIYKKNIFAFILLLYSIRKQKYDYVVDMMDKLSSTSIILCQLSKAIITVGFKQAHNKYYDVEIKPLPKSEYHIVDRTLKLLEPFKIANSNISAMLYYEPGIEADNYAKKYFSNNSFKDKTLIALNISAGTTSRFWGIDNYIKLVELIQSEAQNNMILLFSTIKDRRKAEMISSGNNKTVLIPATESFEYYSALIRHAEIIISPDTSAAHLAAAFNIPSVIISPPLGSENGMYWVPYRTTHKYLVSPLADLSSLAPELVFKAFLEMKEYIKRNSD